LQNSILKTLKGERKDRKRKFRLKREQEGKIQEQNNM
jgi:hypothetical protein